MSKTVTRLFSIGLFLFVPSAARAAAPNTKVCVEVALSRPLSTAPHATAPSPAPGPVEHGATPAASPPAQPAKTADAPPPASSPTLAGKPQAPAEPSGAAPPPSPAPHRR